MYQVSGVRLQVFYLLPVACGLIPNPKNSVARAYANESRE